MRNIIINNGTTGATGDNGSDGLGVDDVRTSLIDNPNIQALYKNKLSDVAAVTFQRSTEALFTNRYGETSFIPASSIGNLTPWSEEYEGKWLKLAGSATWTGVAGLTDPIGGSNAETITANSIITIGDSFMGSPNTSISSSKFMTVSFYLREITGTLNKVGIIVDGVTVETVQTISSSWERYTFQVAALVNNIVSISVDCASGVTFGLFGVQVQDGSNATNYIKTSASGAASSYTGTSIRSNENGYLIERSAQNFISNSEDLTRWTRTGGTVDTIQTSTDFLGGLNKNIRVTYPLGSSTTVTFKQSVTAGWNIDQTASFYAYLVAGSISSITVKVNGGAAVAMPQISTTGYTRLSTELTSGGGTQEVEISITSSALNAVLDIMGFQLESGDLSSYVRTGNASYTRSPDLLFIDSAGAYAKPSDPWSIYFDVSGVATGSSEKYIFNAYTATASDQFYAYFVNSDLVVKNGTHTTTFPNVATNGGHCLTFNGSVLTLYINKVLIATDTVTGASNYNAPQIFAGSNLAGSKGLTAYIQTLLFYDVELTLNDVKYLTGAN